MRLFVALELPAAVRAGLGEIAQRLRPVATPAVRWTNPAGIHLTLKFIGEVAAGQRSGIEAALAGVRGAQSIPVIFRGLGWFPDARRARVLWAGAGAGKELAELAASIEQALEPLGIPREEREFLPHLTLARIKEARGLECLRQEVERLGTAEFGRAVYQEFDLMESTLRPQGAVYTRLERFAFASAPAASAPGSTR